MGCITTQLLEFEIKKTLGRDIASLQIINRSNQKLKIYLLDSVQNSKMPKISIGSISVNFQREFNFEKESNQAKVLIAKNEFGDIKWADYINLDQKEYTIYSSINLSDKTLKLLNAEYSAQDQAQKKHSITIALLCLLCIVNVFLIFKKSNKT